MKSLTLREFYGDTILNAVFSKDVKQEPQKGFKHKLLSNSAVSGNMYYHHFGQFVVCYQDWAVLDPFQLLIDHPEDLVKFQFEITGHSIFSDISGREIAICSGQQQFIYLPPTSGTIYYPSSRSVLDIHIDFDFLLDLLQAQGFTKPQLSEHFQKHGWTFFKKAIPITLDQSVLIRNLIDHSYHGRFAEEYIRCKAIEIILSVFTAGTDSIEGSTWNNQDLLTLSEIKSYLDSHFAEELSLKKISRAFGINEFKLKKAFKERYGDTVFGHIRKSRIKHAMHLLQHSNLDIKTISYSCGFKYPHHFSQLFSQYYNCRPSEVRSKGFSLSTV
ncbi:helix-turn-helix transcriptional regulator [Sphingobacterium faecale]|uniref:Helix-turn-helix transcriptional regulator n=1 Tax=Sphingobacterium faecale TaxID=2803775 RepID=A0ABS1R8Z2_9SPHI|nr:AraC family transcriptional regulator [Sphingobacterium faecale]MBL1411014.1 helix-turn-helix transcriptional regulator [Sphingobacterium faecale]